MFVDRAELKLKAGNGGNGCVSFRREARINKGGPNGGNGGKGGDIVLVCEDGMGTLYDYRGRLMVKAKDGEQGGRKQCTGGDAPDELVKLPAGTQVFEAKTGELLADLKSGDRIILCKGGEGGFGNEHFKTSTNQSPRTAEPGEVGQEYHVRLELKLIADVGLVGKPNAGKSTLLKAMTRANPKIANYPFTTLAPQLGISELENGKRFVIADIPGLIEGASTGAGLGLDFLRHVERTRVIVHLLDLVPQDGSDPVKNYKTIRKELKKYSKQLDAKEELVVLNKSDLVPDAKALKKQVAAICTKLKLDPKKDILVISGATRQGLDDLSTRVWKLLHPRGGGKTPSWKKKQETALV